MATAALRALRTRLDQHQRAASPKTLPVHDALSGLLPDAGLKRGATVAVEGSMSLVLALLAGPSAAGLWGAIVGVPEVGIAAASEFGVDLGRLVLVPRPSDSWAVVVAALTDAIDVIVVRPLGRVAGNDARRLSARARQRGAVLVSLGEWEGADLRLTATSQEWRGLADGYGRLRARSLTVRVSGRGGGAAPREERIWLPADESAVPLRPALRAVPEAV